MLPILLAILSTFLVSSKAQTLPEPTSNATRSGKALSIFQVVRFPNIGCVGSSTLNGTCYTASECTNKGGTSSGSCASGFGVCCTFTLGCGSIISENCTYFQSASPTQPGGQCGATICKCSSDICQLRLDFNTFVITGPNTYTLTSVLLSNGGYVTAGTGASESTNCFTDTFSVTGSPRSPPVICGTNTGYHMYVDASPGCNTLLFQMNPAAVGTSLATRQWNIKISQISCFSPWLPPPGCVQYYTGVSNYFNSYNYAGGMELANQRQTICMRRERGYCKLCVSPSSATATTDFSVSGSAAIGVANSKCCGYGAMGTTDIVVGYDCLIIPNAFKYTGSTHINNHFCGRLLVATAAGGAAAKTVCTSQIPFNLQFITDGFSRVGASTIGFKLVYFQTTC